MKKFLAALLIVSMAFALFACAGGGGSPGSPASSASSAPPASPSGDAVNETVAKALARIAQIQKPPNSPLVEIKQPTLTLDERKAMSQHEIYSYEEYISIVGMLPPYEESRAHLEKALPDKKYDTIRIGAALNFLGAAYFAGVEEAIRLGCQEYGFDYTILICDFDTNLQNSHIDQFLMEKYDCIVIDPSDPLASVSMVKRCVDAGIPVITMGEVLGNVVSQNVTTLTVGQYEAAFQVGLYVAEKFKDKEIIAGVLLGMFGSTSAEAHTNGQVGGIIYERSKQYGIEISKEDAMLKGQILWEEVRNTGKGALPELDFAIAVSNGGGDWTEEGGMKCGEEMILATNGTMNLCISDNDVMALGAMRAIEQMGYPIGPDGVQFSGCGDSYGPALAAIKDGKILVTAFGSPYAIARSTIDLAKKIFIDGYDANNMCSLTVLPVVVITADNVDKFYDPAFEYAFGVEMELYTVDDHNAGNGLKYYK